MARSPIRVWPGSPLLDATSFALWAGWHVEMGFLVPYLALAALPSGPHPGLPVGRKFLVLISTETSVCHPLGS